MFGNQVKHIPDYTFYKCTGLEEVSLPASVISIGEAAFRACNTLQHVEFGESLETIGENAFYDCGKLESITLPEGLTYLSPGAFGSNGNLRHITFNAIDCHTSDFNMATPVFTAPCQLETFVIGNKVTRIPYKICENQTSIKDIVIPNSVKIIESRAFANTGLTEVFLPAGVTEIGSGAFGSNKQLKRVVVASNEAAQAASPFSGNALESIMVPDVAAYGKAQGWSDYSSLLRPMVSFSRDRFVYSGKLPETEAVNNLTGYTLRLGALELNKDAGAYTARAEASYTGPHAFTVSVPFAYQIAKAPLTLTPADVEKVYGDRNPATYGYTQEGLGRRVPKLHIQLCERCAQRNRRTTGNRLGPGTARAARGRQHRTGCLRLLRTTRNVYHKHSRDVPHHSGRRPVLPCMSGRGNGPRTGRTGR